MSYKHGHIDVEGDCYCDDPLSVHGPLARQQEKIALQRVDGWLTVPTEAEPSYIPLGMTPEDFKLLEDSLALWKSRIIKPMIEAEPPIALVSRGEQEAKPEE